jgi:HEAT repeat protein
MDITTRRRPMAVTSEQVRAVLDRDEPDYEEAARLGPDALPFLQRFVESGDPSLAPKAAYLAGRIGDPQAAPILELAAASADSSVRAAAAHGARHLRPEQAEPVLSTLLDDDDPAVRKTALQAVPAAPSPALLAKLNVLREVEPEPMVRELAAELFERASRGSR